MDDDYLEISRQDDPRYPVFLRIHAMPRPGNSDVPSNFFALTRGRALRAAWILVKLALRPRPTGHPSGPGGGVGPHPRPVPLSR